jgi:hypothetical protein
MVKSYRGSGSAGYHQLDEPKTPGGPIAGIGLPPGSKSDDALPCGRPSCRAKVSTSRPPICTHSFRFGIAVCKDLGEFGTQQENLGRVIHPEKEDD